MRLRRPTSIHRSTPRSGSRGRARRGSLPVRAELPDQDGRTVGVRPVRGRDRRLAGLPDAPRVSPRPHLRRRLAATPAAATDGAGGEPAADRARAANRARWKSGGRRRSPPMPAIRTATRSPTSGARRPGSSPRRAIVRRRGRADAGRSGAGHGRGGRRQGRHGQRHGHDPGHSSGPEGDRVRGRPLRLRPLLAAARKRRAPWTRRSGRCRRTRISGSRSKATPATSARPNTTSRSASGVRQRSASLGVAASAPIGSAP